MPSDVGEVFFTKSIISGVVVGAGSSKSVEEARRFLMPLTAATREGNLRRVEEEEEEVVRGADADEDGGGEEEEGGDEGGDEGDDDVDEEAEEEGEGEGDDEDDDEEDEEIEDEGEDEGGDGDEDGGFATPEDVAVAGGVAWGESATEAATGREKDEVGSGGGKRAPTG